MAINLGIRPDLGDRRILHPGKWRPLRSLVGMAPHRPGAGP